MAPSQPKPRAILFDWDNTLVDTWTVVHFALKATFEAMDQTPWTLEECKLRVRASARDAFPLLFGPRAAEATEVFYRAYAEGQREQLRPLAGAASLIEGLAGQGLHLGIVSNKQGALLRAELELLGWSRHFMRAVGATDAARDKPFVDPVHLALSARDLAPSEEIWFVGDTDIDLLCAVNAGCLPVLLRPEAPGEGEFADCRPRLHVRTCEELAHLLVP